MLFYRRPKSMPLLLALAILAMAAGAVLVWWYKGLIDGAIGL